MEKVFVVIENYTFEKKHDTKVSVYKDKKRALGAFKFIVERERKDTWVATKRKVSIEENEGYFHAFVEGQASAFETYVKVEEKEVW
jgi:hypothetical protein